jgi:hypothetical protein
LLLGGCIGQSGEVRAHHLPFGLSVVSAEPSVDVCGALQAAEHHRGCERREDYVEA